MVQSLLPAFLLFANLFEVHFPPLTSPVMKSQSSIGSSINSWGTSLRTELQLYFTLLIRTPRGQKFSQFSIHLTGHLPSPCLSSVSMRKLWEKALLKLRWIHCSQNVNIAPICSQATRWDFINPPKRALHLLGRSWDTAWREAGCPEQRGTTRLCEVGSTSSWKWVGTNTLAQQKVSLD